MLILRQQHPTHLEDRLKPERWFYDQYSPHTMRMHITDRGEHALVMLGSPNRQPEETLALTWLCSLTSGATVNSVSEVSTQEAVWADSYQGTLIGFANLWAGWLFAPVLTRVPTCRKVTSGYYILKYQPTMTQITPETSDIVSPHWVHFQFLSRKIGF